MVDVVQADLKHGILFVVQTMETAKSAKDIMLTPWSSGKAVLSDRDRDSVRMIQNCSNFLYKMHHTAKFLLKGIARSVHEVTVSVRNAPRPIAHSEPELVKPDGTFCNLMFGAHSVLRVTLKCGKSYCLDPTGAQFGWHGSELILPWEEFVNDRVHTIIVERPFGDSFCHRLDQLSEGEHYHFFFLQALICYDVDKVVERWLQTAQITTGQLLKSSGQDFLAKLETLKHTMLEHVEMRISAIAKTKVYDSSFLSFDGGMVSMNPRNFEADQRHWPSEFRAWFRQMQVEYRTFPGRDEQHWNRMMRAAGLGR